MATVSKVARKDGYVYRVQVRRNGKYLSRNFQRKRDADAFARKVEGDMDAHRALLNPQLRDNTLAALLDRYIGAWTGKDGSTLTRLAWWRDRHGALALCDVDGDLVREALAELRSGEVHRYQGTRGIFATGKARSPATINRYLAALGGAYRVAIDEGWFGLKESPTRGVARKAEHNDRHGRRFGQGERERLLQACDESQWPGLGLVVRIAFGTGLRRGEIAGLRWSAVDLGEQLVWIADTKNDDPRGVPLIDELCERLQHWAKVRRIDSDLVFPSERNPERPRDFEAAWRSALSRAGISDFRFHDLRHSAASYLVDAGVNHVLIAEILGHRTLAMVKRYGHGSTEAKRAALTDAMKGKVG